MINLYVTNCWIFRILIKTGLWEGGRGVSSQFHESEHWWKEKIRIIKPVLNPNNKKCYYVLGLGITVFNIYYNNISVISWRSALLVEETTCYKSLTTLSFNKMLWKKYFVCPPLVLMTDCRRRLISTMMLDIISIEFCSTPLVTYVSDLPDWSGVWAELDTMVQFVSDVLNKFKSCRWFWLPKHDINVLPRKIIINIQAVYSLYCLAEK